MAAIHVADMMSKPAMASIPPACDIRSCLDPLGALRGVGIQSR